MMQRTEFPNSNIKIAVAILDIISADKEYNLQKVGEIISKLDEDTDVLILPEMFSTGVIMDTEILAKMAEPKESETIKFLENLSVKNGIAIWGTFIAVEDGNYFNRGFMIQSDGTPTQYYDKRHLFRLGGEAEIYSSGKSESPIITIKSWRFKMCICYDLRFPVWNRSTNLSYDCLVVPANWAASRSFAWRQLLIARAIENQVFTVGANRIGKDIYGEYDVKDILIYNYQGKDITERTDSDVVYALLEAEKFNRDRSRFTPWLDADSFSITI